MGFTIPNAAGLTYSDQAAPDSGDYAIMGAGAAGYYVSSGCAVSTSGSSLVLTIASGLVVLGGSAVTVAGNTATVTAAHATLTRYDLVVLDSSGVASVIAGTPAAAPVWPAFTPGSQVVLAAVTVPPTATVLTGANVVDKRWIVSGARWRGGDVIDYAERAVAQNVQTTGVTVTDVGGLQITIPADVDRPYEVTFWSQTLAHTGTAAAGTFTGIQLSIAELTAWPSTFAYPGFGTVNFEQGPTAVTKDRALPLGVHRRFEPTGVERYFKVAVALTAAAPAGWTDTTLLADDAPTTGYASPMFLKAVCL